VGETDGVSRVRFDADAGTVSGALERVVAGLPAGGNHWTRTIRFGPDGWLYVSVGSSCNVCVEEHPWRASLLRFRPDGGEGEIFASGLRNAVGFDWRPGTAELYATDNGRDLLGDDQPPCELNRVVKDGFYGWPFANGDRDPDPDLGAGKEGEISSSIPPAHGFRAHNAPLGIVFLRHQPAGSPLEDSALVALHGSWNRTHKDGYKVVALHWDPGGEIREEDYEVGFLEGDDVIGRPVDVAEGPDGAVYVSDDYGGMIYRVTHGPGARAAVPGNPSPPIPGLPGDPDPATTPGEPERAARGEALYEELRCFGCHESERADPGIVALPLVDLHGRYGRRDLDALLRTPPPPMPDFELSDAQRSDLSAFLLARDPGGS
jgi:glucose/arabinose dehydrogenase